MPNTACLFQALHLHCCGLDKLRACLTRALVFQVGPNGQDPKGPTGVFPLGNSNGAQAGALKVLIAQP